MICKRTQYSMFNRDQLRQSLFKPTKMKERDSTNIWGEHT